MEAVLHDVAFWHVLGYILGLAIASVALGVAARQLPEIALAFRRAWYIVRKYRPDIERAFDQPTDPLVQAVAERLGVEPEFVQEAMMEFWRSVVSGVTQSAGGDVANDNIIPFSPNKSVTVKAQIRNAGELPPAGVGGNDETA